MMQQRTRAGSVSGGLSVANASGSYSTRRARSVSGGQSVAHASGSYSTRRAGSVSDGSATAHASGSYSTRRAGSIALELLLMAPVVLGLIFAALEIGMMTAANEHLAAASREGCRVAALGGGPDEIIRAVKNHLGQGNLGAAQVVAILTQQQDGTSIVTALTDDNGQPIEDPFGYNGQGSNDAAQPIPSGEPVLVRVQTPTSNAVPDLMTLLGISIQNSTLVGQTIMRKE